MKVRLELPLFCKMVFSNKKKTIVLLLGTFPVRNVIANKNEVYFQSGANQNRNNITNK